VDRYETLLQDLAARRRCEGIICGHIHTPENKQIGDVHYLNSGDWVESLSAIIEHDDGRMELVYYRDFIRQLHLANYTPYESVAAVA
jgi:UDP-2,3-diacylglucosamine pyrophosphatase LpxH